MSQSIKYNILSNDLRKKKERIIIYTLAQLNKIFTTEKKRQQINFERDDQLVRIFCCLCQIIKKNHLKITLY